MAPAEPRILKIKSRAYLTNGFKISTVRNQVLTLLFFKTS